MNRRRQILLALAGLTTAVAVSVPLIQQLSVELLQLQIRERFLEDDTSFAEFARDQEVSEDFLIAQAGLGGIPRDQLRTMTLAEIAARRGQSVRAFKRDLIDAAFEGQVREANGWSAWFRRPSPPGGSD